MKAPDEIRTPRLALRKPRLEDAQAIFDAYASDPEVTRYLIWRPHESVEDTKDFLTGSLKPREKGLVFTWQLWQDGEIVGGIALRPESAHRVSIGFGLARAHWGKGLVPEAIVALKEWAFGEASYQRLWAVCDVDNPASARVMEKAGMQHEGTLRRWILHPNISDTPRDCHCYAAVK